MVCFVLCVTILAVSGVENIHLPFSVNSSWWDARLTGICSSNSAVEIGSMLVAGCLLYILTLMYSGRKRLGTPRGQHQIESCIYNNTGVEQKDEKHATSFSEKAGTIRLGSV